MVEPQTAGREAHRVGEPIDLTGYADDYDTPIVGVQFSLNGSRT